VLFAGIFVTICHQSPFSKRLRHIKRRHFPILKEILEDPHVLGGKTGLPLFSLKNFKIRRVLKFFYK
jgi:hypothetical protein